MPDRLNKEMKKKRPVQDTGDNFHTVSHQIHKKVDGSFELFHNNVKIPGTYETKEAAFDAIAFPTYLLREISNEVNVILGRNITEEDLR